MTLTPANGPQVPDATHPIYILAMDHRDSLAKQVYDIPGELTPEQSAQISAGKMLVFEGAATALGDLPAAGRPGVLVDERYGAAVARAARERGFALIMPIERSGRPFFELEFGDFDSGMWLGHVEEFDPDYIKVLLRDNPEFDAKDRQAQQEHMATISQELRKAGRKLIIELLVPAAGAQKDTDGDAYDRDVRPALTEQLIREFHAAGVEPEIWKLEGYESAEAAEKVAAVTREGQREDVRCIVLGRNSTEEHLDNWLRTAAPMEGFAGFAIGRSIWEQPLIDQLAGKTSEDELRAAVGASFSHYANTYAAAGGPR
jgi:myo-inositol catabolism protein IolC